MPKKLGTNSKAIESRERKATQKKAVQEKAAKDAEDALWVDNDRQMAKKKSRKEDEERKKAEQLRKKAENKAMLEQEMASIKTTTGKQSIQKITQAQINQEVERRNKVIETLYKPKEPVSLQFAIRLVLVHDSHFNMVVFTIPLTYLIAFFLLLYQESNVKLVNNEPLVENLNRLEPDTIEASGIDDAIKALR